MSSPRIRQQLRQANRVADNGKLSAAADLFRKILEEAPDEADAWAGLGRVMKEPEDKIEAFEKALTLEPENQTARRGLALLRGELVEERAAAPLTATVIPGTPETIPLDPVPEPEDDIPAYEAPVDISPWVQPDGTMVCYRHNDTEVTLRCNRCGRPICIKCSNRTSVGYRCPDCLRELEQEYFTSKPADYVIAGIVAFIGGLLGGFIASFLGWFVIFLGAGGGTLLGRVIFRAIGRRRGRFIPQVSLVSMIIGALLPSLGTILSVFLLMGAGGGIGVLFSLLWPVVFVVLAAASLWYTLKV